MALSLASVHKALLSDPSLVFVQTKDGELVSFSSWEGCAGARVLHVYAGSFNPLHDGHKAIYESMPYGRRWGVARCFELSINRFDKAPVSIEELTLRLRQFVGYALVLITNVAKFVEKAGVLRGVTGDRTVFHVGGDTMTRILAHSSNQEVAGFNCEFVYYSRIMGDKQVEFPSRMPANCSKGAEIPEDLMRISSTSLRNAGKVLG